MGREGEEKEGMCELLYQEAKPPARKERQGRGARPEVLGCWNLEAATHPSVQAS